MTVSTAPILVVLAGGKSTRLWPLEEKALLEFMGTPLFSWQLRQYAHQGFAEVALIVNPDNGQALNDLAQALPDLQVNTFVQQEPKGMGDALLLLRQYLADRGNPPIYITQVHDLFEPTLHYDVLAGLARGDADSLLAACEVTSYFPGGYLSLAADGRIANVIEKPGPGNEPSNLVTVVAHLHRDPLALLDEISRAYASATTGDDHYERAMASLMPSKVFRPVVYRGRWDAIKFPWHVLDIMDNFLGRIAGQTVAASARIADSAAISGPVVIEEGVRLMPGSLVIGPAFVGAGTIIGNNSLVRGSMLGRNAVVGYATEVVRSYVGNDVWFHTNYVGDSVIADNVGLGSGAITANLRLDEQEVRSAVKDIKLDTGRKKLGAIIGSGARIGVNALLMPGTKVGRRAIVGPGVVLSRDLANATQVVVKQDLETRPVQVDLAPEARDAFRARI